jgi:hypothetical protein
MATATQAIEKIAEATGQYTASVALLARHCRNKQDDRGPLWPRSSQGGRSGAAHVNEFHAINLTIGMLATNTLAQAVEQIARYRALNRMGNPLRPIGSTVLSGNMTDYPADVIADDLFPGSTLGEALESLVRSMMSHEKRAQACEKIRDVTVFRSTETAYINTICGTVAYYKAPPGLLSVMMDEPNFEEKPEAEMRITASVPIRYFEILADLVLDTERVREKSQLSPDDKAPEAAGSTNAEDADTTTPATVGAGPAHVDEASQPGANPVNPAERDIQQDSDERERPQSPTPSSSPGPPSSDQTDQLEDETLWPRSNLRTQSAA